MRRHPSERLQRLAASWIFPGLVAAMVVGNQGWTLGPLHGGQVLSWINDLSALIIVLGRFPGRRWPLVIFTGAIVFKLASALPAVADRADLGFDVMLGLLFCAAGAAMVSQRPGLVYRQVLVIAVLSIPLMVLQMSGLAPWSEALNTENVKATLPRPALFVGEEDLHYRTSQARPSGITHSNNFLSLLAAFGLVLHFSRIKTPRLTRRDLIFCTFALLTMAKIVLLIYAVVLGWLLIMGVRRERHRAVRLAMLTGVLLAGYWVFFPGLLANNISLYKIRYSFFIRANDFARLLPETNALRGWMLAQLEGTPQADWQGAVSLSGYAQIIGILPYVMVLAVLAAPIVWRGFRRLRQRYPEIVDLTVLTAFLVILYPTAVPLFRAQIFAFVAGFALVPVFILWDGRFFPGTVGRRLFEPAPAEAR